MLNLLSGRCAGLLGTGALHQGSGKKVRLSLGDVKDEHACCLIRLPKVEPPQPALLRCRKSMTVRGALAGSDAGDRAHAPADAAFPSRHAGAAKPRRCANLASGAPDQSRGCTPDRLEPRAWPGFRRASHLKGRGFASQCLTEIDCLAYQTSNRCPGAVQGRALRLSFLAALLSGYASCVPSAAGSCCQRKRYRQMKVDWVPVHYKGRRSTPRRQRGLPEQNPLRYEPASERKTRIQEPSEAQEGALPGTDPVYRETQSG